jgi:predicted glutamine amidotransferase
MCQLLGLSSNKSVDIKFSLLEFKQRGRINSHGYGFSYYEEGKRNPILFKDPTSLYFQDVDQRKFEFKSKIVIGHVRLISCGNQSHPNTHPFIKEAWSFAHNGTVREVKNSPLKLIQPTGDTDSEYAFYYLLEKIGSKTDLYSLAEILRKESMKTQSYGRFNYLLSNGIYLFAYGDNSLYFTKRQAPFIEVTLKDTQHSLDLNEIKEPNEKAVLIATEPLTQNENWEKLNGLAVFKDGENIII